MAYRDKVTATKNSICYEYKPERECEENTPRKWSYKTTRADFGDLFAELATSVSAIVSMDQEVDALDVGVTTFIMSYAEGTRQQRSFCALSYVFATCFRIAKRMVPSCEKTPKVLSTKEDYEARPET